MNISECENRNRAILENALLWAEGKEFIPLEILDISIIAEILKINLPKCFYNFVNTSEPGTVKAYGAHTSIMKTLDKIQKELLQIDL